MHCESDVKAKASQSKIFALLRQKLYGCGGGDGSSTTSNAAFVAGPLSSKSHILTASAGGGGGAHPYAVSPPLAPRNVSAATSPESQRIPHDNNQNHHHNNALQHRVDAGPLTTILPAVVAATAAGQSSSSSGSNANEVRGGGGASSSSDNGSGGGVKGGHCWLCSTQRPPFIDHKMQLLYSVAEDFPKIPIYSAAAAAAAAAEQQGINSAGGDANDTSLRTPSFDIAPSKASRLNRRSLKVLSEWECVEAATAAAAVATAGGVHGDCLAADGDGGAGSPAYVPPLSASGSGTAPSPSAPLPHHHHHRFPPLDLSKMLLCLPCFRLCYDGFSRPTLLNDAEALETRRKLSQRVHRLARMLSEQKSGGGGGGVDSSEPTSPSNTIRGATLKSIESSAGMVASSGTNNNCDDGGGGEQHEPIVTRSFSEVIPLSLTARSERTPTSKSNRIHSKSLATYVGIGIGGASSSTAAPDGSFRMLGSNDKFPTLSASNSYRSQKRGGGGGGERSPSDTDEEDDLQHTTALFVNTRGSFLLAAAADSIEHSSSTIDAFDCSQNVIRTTKGGGAATSEGNRRATPQQQLLTVKTGDAHHHGGSGSVVRSPVILGARGAGTLVMTSVDSTHSPNTMGSRGNRIGMSGAAVVVGGESPAAAVSTPAKGTVVPSGVAAAATAGSSNGVASGSVVKGSVVTEGGASVGQPAIVVTGTTVTGRSPSTTPVRGTIVADPSPTNSSSPGSAVTQGVPLAVTQGRVVSQEKAVKGPTDCIFCGDVITNKDGSHKVVKDPATGAIIPSYCIAFHPNPYFHRVWRCSGCTTVMTVTLPQCLVCRQNAPYFDERMVAGAVEDRFAASRNGYSDPYAMGASSSAEMNPTQALDELLLNIGASRQTQTGDGNCLFRALAHQLFATECHELVRELCCDFIEDHREDYESLVVAMGLEGTTTAAAREELIFPQYIARMRMSGTWGDELCVHAAARLFTVRIHVLTSDYPNSRWHLVFQPDPEEDEKGEAEQETIVASTSRGKAGVTNNHHRHDHHLSEFDDCSPTADDRDEYDTMDSHNKRTGGAKCSGKAPSGGSSHHHHDHHNLGRRQPRRVTDIFLLYLRPVHYDDIVSPPMVKSVMASLADMLQHELTAEEEWIE